MRRISCSLITLLMLLSVDRATARKPEDGPVLSQASGHLALADAISLALAGSPEIAGAEKEIRAREGGIRQAGAIPNPELSVTVENIGSDIEETGARESTLQLGQRIELGGKRSARVDSATAARDLARWELESKRIDVVTRVRHAFLDVLSNQRRLELANESVRVSEEITETVSERVRAGKVSPIEETRVGVAMIADRIERDRANADLEIARSRLAALWGDTNPQFEGVVGDLTVLPVIPSLQALLDQIERSPDLARWTSEIAGHEALLRLERARSIPDFTIAGGFRRFELGGDAFVATASVPLPLFDQNRGARQEARERLARAAEEQRASDLNIRQLLTERYTTFTRSEAEVRSIRHQLVPGAESVFAAVSEGYRLGKFGYLEVLDARRTLASARAQLVSVQTELHHAFADLQRLTAVSTKEMMLGSDSDEDQ